MVGCPLPTPSPGSVVPLKKFGKVRTCSELVCVPLHPRRMFGACHLWGAPSIAPSPRAVVPPKVFRKCSDNVRNWGGEGSLTRLNGSWGKAWPENGSKPSETKINIGVSEWKSYSVCVQWPAALVLLALWAERRGGRRGKTQPRTQLPIKGPAYGFSKILDSRLGPLVGNWAGV